ncbi:MAG: quinate 5-dehydrogenase [Bacillota bacterium]|nr:quinate 5-dehydrogenase [Bacillota bacterium]MDW7685333.1 quinate 5-dehydrogenase [Bacillota bacterium]
MKRVVSISLGSSKRNHAVEVEMAGEMCRVERIGTDGDIKKMIAMITELDGNVEAFGLGGMDLYVYAGNQRYTFREAKVVVRAAKITPIVDGSGLKNTLERKVVRYLQNDTDILNGNPHVLMMSGADRFGMAEAMEEAGCRLTCGDLIFSIGLPLPLRSLKSLERVARVLAPLITQLPLSMVYPTGKKQEENKPKAQHLFAEADIIAGDFHFIRRYMPMDMNGKIIITNTTTVDDVALLKSRGVKTLVTTTPELNGRSFGTNVMEGLLVALSGKSRELKPDEYEGLLSQVNFVPRITQLNE